MRGLLFITLGLFQYCCAYAQKPFAHMSLQEKEACLPNFFPGDTVRTHSDYAGSEILRLKKGWFDKAIIKPNTIVCIINFDCTTNVKLITSLDSLAEAKNVGLMLVSADDWSLLNGIKKFTKTKSIHRVIYTLDMESYNKKYNPVPRMKQAFQELLGTEPTIDQLGGIFYMTTSKELVYNYDLLALKQFIDK